MVNRCDVCWLPSASSPCSERCRGLRRRKAELMVHRAEIGELVISELARLVDGATACPGTVCKRILDARGVVLDARDALLCLRELLFALRAAKRLRFFQKGRVVPPGKETIRGPFRLGLR